MHTNKTYTPHSRLRSCSVFQHMHRVAVHVYFVFFKRFLGLCALRMAYDNEACCFAHHARHYHGRRGNSSRVLDLDEDKHYLWLPSMDDSIRPAICVLRAWRKTPTLPVTPVQLKRPGIGRNASCALGDCSTSRT